MSGILEIINGIKWLAIISCIGVWILIVTKRLNKLFEAIIEGKKRAKLKVIQGFRHHTLECIEELYKFFIAEKVEETSADEEHREIERKMDEFAAGKDR